MIKSKLKATHCRISSSVVLVANVDGSSSTVFNRMKLSDGTFKLNKMIIHGCYIANC